MDTPELKIAKPLGSSNGTAAGGILKSEMKEEHDRLIGEHQKGVEQHNALTEQINALVAQRQSLEGKINAVGGGILTLRKIMGVPQVDPAVVDAAAADLVALPEASTPAVEPTASA